MKAIKLKVCPYKVEYSIVRKNGLYGLRLAEYENGTLLKVESFLNLTANEDEINFILNLFTKENVFIIHAESLLEDMGYTADKK